MPLEMSSAPVRAYGLSLSSFETAIKIFSCLSSKNCHNSPSRRSIPQKPVLNEGHRYKLLPAAVGPLFTDTLTSKKTDGLGSASQQLFKPAFAQRQNYCTGVNLGQDKKKVEVTSFLFSLKFPIYLLFLAFGIYQHWRKRSLKDADNFETL